jgi:hypothetical protein
LPVEALSANTQHAVLGLRPIMRRSLYIFALLLMLPALGSPCSIERRKPGTPIEVPRALFEARVIEEHSIEYEYRPGKFTDGQEIVVEVTRSLIGIRALGERITKSYDSGCGWGVALNARVLFADFDGNGRFTKYARAWEGERFEFGFGEVADVDGVWRTSKRPSLARVRLRGEVSDSAAEALLRSSRLDSTSGCDIVVAKKFSHVACGQAIDGSGANATAMFEKVDENWVEVARYGAGIVSPADASATTTS